VAETLGCELDDVDGDELEDELDKAVCVGSEGKAEALADVLFVAEDVGNALDEADGDLLSELLGVGVDVGAALIDAEGVDIDEKVGNDVMLGDDELVPKGEGLAEPLADPDEEGLGVGLSDAADDAEANELYVADTDGVPELDAIDD